MRINYLKNFYTEIYAEKKTKKIYFIIIKILLYIKIKKNFF